MDRTVEDYQTMCRLRFYKVEGFQVRELQLTLKEISTMTNLYPCEDFRWS